MFQNGLLILTSPVVTLLGSIPKILSSAAGHVQKVLYVHLAPDLKPKELLPAQIACTTAVRNVITRMYTFTASHYQDLDLRVIVGNIGSPPRGPRPCVARYNLQHPYEVLLTNVEGQFLLEYAARHFVPADVGVSVKLISTGEGEVMAMDSLNEFDNIVLGGTFDRLHTGHKILLNDALIRCRKRLIIGVTDGPMNSKKVLCELIEPCETRIAKLKEFLEDVKPQLSYHIVPILDPYGPSITETDLQCIVASKETTKGAESVNKKRLEKGLNELELVIIDLIEDDHKEEGEEQKISSSSIRRRLLGRPLRTPTVKPDLAPLPYVLGFTGGIASGKSSVCKRLEKLGAAIVDCDKLGHQAYEKGGAAYDKVIEAFGADILDSDGRIDRKKLGSKVFSNPESRKKLNGIVWPVIQDLAKQQIESFYNRGYEVVVLDAAVLLEAGWDDMVHEVWTTIIPTEEAVKRIKERNNLDEEEAKKRIFSQMSNKERVEAADVVLCTLWEYSFTQKQVEKAWRLLQERLHVDRSHL